MKFSGIIGVMCFALLLMPIRSSAQARESVEKRIQTLRAQLADPDDRIREKAAYEIAKMGPAGRVAVGDLAKLVENDSSAFVRRAAVAGLRGVFFLGKADPPDEKAIKALVKAMWKDADLEIRWAACESLGTIGPGAKSAATDLLELMKGNEAIELRGRARISLFFVAGPECKQLTPRLMEMYKKGIKDEIFEFYVLIIMGKIGAEETTLVPLLVDIVKRKKANHPRSREAALCAIEILGAKASTAIPAVLDALKESLTFKEGDARNVAGAAVNALGGIGPDAKEALPILHALSNDPRQSGPLREVARDAIRRIENKRDPIFDKSKGSP